MDKNKNKPPGTWISAAETATITGLTLRTVLGRAASGKMKAKIPVDVPLSEDGKQNYVFLLEDLSPNAQLEYHKLHLPEEQKCSIDLATPRSNYGDEYVNDFLNTAALVREAENIRRTYKNESTKYLMHLAEDNGISLSTLYRLCGKPAAKELSHCYLDPVYMQKSLPQTMCLWSADFVYALYLDHHQQFSQNAIFRELQKLEGLSCIDCPYYPGRKDLQDGEPICTKCEGTMVIPNNRRTLNRLLSQIPPQMLCYCRKGARQWRSEYGHHVVREKPMLVNEHWQGDHHVFDLFVRVKLKRYRNDRLYEQEVAVRPVLTAWMDTATGCLVGWCISIIPNADTIAEAFCRAVTFTVDDEFHGLPKTILVDCGKDYKSKLIENLPEDFHADNKTELCLNKRFSGLGLLPALGVEVNHALPYHPQSKSIERMFGTIEREWISKLPGWCYNSVANRPKQFYKYLDKLLKNKELLTLEEFVEKFRKEILPAYHHFREDSPPDMEGWIPSFSSMSPMERYHALEKPYLITPEWRTLSALKLHHAPNCKIGHQGIKFQNVYYWNDKLRFHMMEKADVFYHAVDKPLSPGSITVTVGGRFVCEAFPVRPMPFSGARQSELQEHLDVQRLHERELKSSIARINRSVSAILPETATASTTSDKVQLRDQCYAAAVSEEPEPEKTQASDNSQTKKAKAYELQKALSILFGE